MGIYILSVIAFLIQIYDIRFVGCWLLVVGCLLFVEILTTGIKHCPPQHLYLCGQKL